MNPTLLLNSRNQLKKTSTLVRTVDGKLFREDGDKVTLLRDLSLETLDLTPPPTFNFSTDDGRTDGLAFLEENGYVVVGEVLSLADIEQAKNLFWEFMSGTESIVDRHEPKTWENRNWAASPVNGIISSDHIGQSDFAWFLRSRPAVRHAFQEVWKTTELLTSFDGANAFRPWTEREDWKTQGGWWHVDQHPAKPGRECVQGLVSVLSADIQTGGLTVIPGSHKTFASLKPFARGDHDLVRVPAFEIVRMRQGKLIQCPPGSLLLWDSRTIHCNSPGLPAQEHVAPCKDLIRIVGYVCMTPKDKASPETLQQRKDAVEEGITTTHWPHIFGYVSTGVGPYIKSKFVVPELVC